MTHTPKPPADRFWPKVNKTDTCWLWLGVVDKAGYSRIWSYEAQGQVYGHRFSYEFHKGQIPDGLVIDHLCRVRHCVNPDHLEVVTRAENNRRGDVVASRRATKGIRTHCPSGHAYDDENTYVNKSGTRQCRACARERYARKRAAA